MLTNQKYFFKFNKLCEVISKLKLNFRCLFDCMYFVYFGSPIMAEKKEHNSKVITPNSSQEHVGASNLYQALTDHCIWNQFQKCRSLKGNLFKASSQKL